MTASPLFEMSADARFLYQRLRSAAVGDIVTYSALAEIIGKPVRGATGALRTALNAALREDRAAFGCVRKVGFKRLSDGEIVSLGESETAGTRRRVKRTVRKLTSVANFAAMLPAKQMRHTALLSVNTMIADVTREKSLERVAGASSGRASELPIQETLKAMGII